MQAGMWLLAISLFSPIAGDTSEVPELLVRAIHHRGEPRTLRLKYRLQNEQPGFATRLECMEARFAGDNVFLIESGDLDGIRSRDPISGQPRFGVRAACLPQLNILDRQRGERWHYLSSLPNISLKPLGELPPFIDPRTFGLYSVALQNCSPVKLLDELRSRPIRWSVHGEGALRRVVGRQTVNEEGIVEWVDEWVIDPAMDHAVLSVRQSTIDKNGAHLILGEATSDYKQMEGRWWPTRSQVHHPRTAISRTMIVEHADFDRPDHPTRLTPDLFNLPTGIKLYRGGFPGLHGVESLRYMGAGRTITAEEWEQVKDQFNPALQEYLGSFRDPAKNGTYPAWWHDAPDRLGLDGVARRPDQWEAYVRRWILRHRPGHAYRPAQPLDEKQVSAAWAILKDCRRRAAPIIDRLASSPPAEPRAMAGAAASPSGAGPRAAASSSSAGIRAAAAGPTSSRPAREEADLAQLERIFHQLRGRLDGLLTSRQQIVDGPPAPARP